MLLWACLLHWSLNLPRSARRLLVHSKCQQRFLSMPFCSCPRLLLREHLPTTRTAYLLHRKGSAARAVKDEGCFKMVCFILIKCQCLVYGLLHSLSVRVNVLQLFCAVCTNGFWWWERFWFYVPAVAFGSLIHFQASQQGHIVACVNLMWEFFPFLVLKGLTLVIVMFVSIGVYRSKANAGGSAILVHSRHCFIIILWKV